MRQTFDRFGASTLTEFSLDENTAFEVRNVPGVKWWPEEVVVSRTAAPTVRPYLAPEGFAPPVPQLLDADDRVVQSFIDRGVLRDYQAVAARTILTQGGLVLGDRVGLGKTRAAAVAAYAASVRTGSPVVILAPKFLRAPWLAELRALGVLDDDRSRFLALEGRTFDPGLVRQPGIRWFFCHYDVISAWWSVLWPLRPAMAVLDEAHYVKNGQSLRGKAAALVAYSCAYRALLTATPVLNRLGEFWHLLTLAGGPWSWGGKKAFLYRYADVWDDEYGLQGGQGVKHSRLAELRERLATCYLRRGLEDVDLDLPPITRQVQGSVCEDDRYEALLQKHPELPGYVEAMVRGVSLGKNALGALGRLRKLTSSIKVPGTVDYVRSMREQGEHVLVFTWERATAERIAKATKGAFVHGGQSQKARDATVEAFRQLGGVLVATYGALGVGVNLQVARVVVMHDLDWTPATLVQAEGRVWRGGQTRNVLSVWRVLEGTLDEYLARMLDEKAQLVAEAAGDPEAQRITSIFADTTSDVGPESWIAEWRAWREGSLR